MPRTRSKTASVKTSAMKIVRDLPDSASWDELMYRIFVRQKIEAGLADLQAGRVHTHTSIRKHFGLAS
jgi:predicted transcriptional regulator